MCALETRRGAGSERRVGVGSSSSARLRLALRGCKMDDDAAVGDTTGRTSAEPPEQATALACAASASQPPAPSHAPETELAMCRAARAVRERRVPLLTTIGISRLRPLFSSACAGRRIQFF